MSPPAEPSVEQLPVFPDSRFVNVAVVGAGRHSTIFRAIDCATRRAVALKLTLQDAFCNPALSERLATLGLEDHVKSLAQDSRMESRNALLREAWRLARVRHPNVISLLDVGRLERDGAVVVVMPLLTGGTLAERELGGRWRDVLDVALQIGEGLAAVHDAGLVHRDFKPGNVLFDGRGSPQVADLGLACEIEELAGSTQIVGTGRYMAPEAFEGRRVGVLDDVYAYCTVVFEMFYGHSPFATIEARMIGEVSDIRRRGGMSARLRRVLVKGLHPDPELRWSSMLAVLDAMRDAARPRRAGRTVAVGITVALAVGVLVSVRKAEADACDAVAGELESVWNSEIRQELDAALGTPRVGDNLQRWANDWLSVRACECEVAEREGREVVATPCSEKLREAFAATVEALETPHLRAGLRYDKLIASLPAPQHCLEHPNDGAWGDGGMLELESLDRRIEALVLLEASDDARSLVHAQMQLARTLSSEFGVARAMFWRGEISRLEGDLDAAAQSFEMVYEDAQRLGTPVLGAEAMLRLTMIAGARGTLAAVDAFALTAASVFAVHDVERLAELRRVQGLALLGGSKEDRARGLARLGEAVSLREQQQRRYGGTSELLSVALESHAQGLRAVGHPAEALEQLERALKLHRREFGRSAPRTRLLLRSKLELVVDLRRFADAEPIVYAIYRHDLDQQDLVTFVADVELVVHRFITVGQLHHARDFYLAGHALAVEHGVADALDALGLELDEHID